MQFWRVLRAYGAILYAAFHLLVITFPGFFLGGILSFLTTKTGVAFRNRFTWHTTGHGAFVFRILCSILGVRFTFRTFGSEVTFDQFFLLNVRPAVVIANHQSLFDIPLVCWVLWRLRITSVRWVLKEELRWTPFGMAAMLTRCAFVQRRKENGAEDLSSVERCATYASEENAVTVLFPEGKRFLGAEPGSDLIHVRRPRLGGFAAVLKAMPGAPVLSITLRWNGGEPGKVLGRTFWDAADFVGKNLHICVEYISREKVDADPDWLNNHWREKDRRLASPKTSLTP